MTAPDLYERQRCLPEVGDAGQARLDQASASIRASRGAMLELAYLHRAGVGRVSVSARAAQEPFPHSWAFRTDAALDVGASAWRALRLIRAELGMKP